MCSRHERFVDDITGQPLDPELCRAARRAELDYFASTGLWDRYSQATVGRVHLEPGDHHLTFRAGGPITGPLIDLRAIRLVPADDEGP